MPHIDVYLCCLGCKARVEPLTPPLGRCSGCQMMQKSDICRQVTSAKLLVMYECDGKNRMMQCHAYDDILREMAGDQDISQESLLNASRYEYVHHWQHQRQENGPGSETQLTRTIKTVTSHRTVYHCYHFILIIFLHLLQIQFYSASNCLSLILDTMCTS